MASMKPKTDGRERCPNHKRRIYIHPDIWSAVENLISARRGIAKKRETVSGVIAKKLKAHIRDNAPLLRKHNFPVPSEAFE